MKILVSSRLFYPSIGGGETNAEILAREFVNAGHQVVVITQIPGDEFDSEGIPFPFRVYRRPNIIQMLNLSRWADVHFHNGISLRDAWPLLFIRRPWVIRHLTWIAHETSPFLLTKIKFKLLTYAKNISISQAIADSLPVKSVIVPNPLRSGVFRRVEGIEKKKDLIFLGRLVSDKGVDILIEALNLLKEKGVRPETSIVGSGEEAETLQQLKDQYHLDCVHFTGKKTGEELVNLLNQHKIIVIPSRWAEPFGVVALEGMACGCIPIGSEQGGLKDAIGSCGLTFKNGDVKDLAEKINILYQEAALVENLRKNIPNHLGQHLPDKVASAYLEVLKQAGDECNQ